MTLPPSASVSGDGGVGVLSEQVRSVSRSIEEIKALVRSLDERMRGYELDNAGTKAVNQTRIEAAHRRIDTAKVEISGLDDRLGLIESVMPLIEDVLKLRTKLIVLVFVSGFLGTSLGALILGLLFNFLFRDLL